MKVCYYDKNNLRYSLYKVYILFKSMNVSYIINFFIHNLNSMYIIIIIKLSYIIKVSISILLIKDLL